MISQVLKNLFHEGRISRSRCRGSKYALSSVLVLAAFGLSAAPIASAQVNVTTQHNDIGRTGQNLNETILTTSNVNAIQFGKLFSQPVVGTVITAQPLYLSNVMIGGAAHNVVYVATRADLVYAFDADSNVGTNASPLWEVSLLDAAHGAASGAQNYAGFGITSTPVIDSLSLTMYVVSLSFEGGQPIFRLHALDVTSGAEKFDGPTTIQGSVSGTAVDSVGGTVTFAARDQRQNASLLLLNGVVYIGFGSSVEGDEGSWHGWIFAYAAADGLPQTGVFCTTPNGNRGGVWMSGTGLAADQLDPVNSPFGRMFVATGNGDFTGTFPYGSNMDYGDSVVNLDLTNGAPTITDDFTPSDQAYLLSTDGDQGSGGVMIVPTQTTGSYPNLLVQTGKSGTLFLLDRENLGGYSRTTNQVVQALPLAVGNTGPMTNTAGVWSAPAYWNGNVYYWGVYDYLKSFPLVDGLLSATPTTSSELGGYPGVTPSISANGATQGIVWAANVAGSSTVLLAHDASNVATTLYSSATNPGRDGAGALNSHAVPTIANGHVYLATTNQLNVYGLLSSAQTSAPKITPGSKPFVGPLSVKLSDTSPNAAIYYTTDGTPSSTASTLYTGPISVTSSQTINAVASSPGLSLSDQSWASYTQSVTSPPTFSPAAVAYSSAQSVTISDATAGAVIYYTTDGTTPTIASPVYSNPVTVSTSETLNAIAVAPGYAISGVGTASYAIDNSSTILVNEAAGFASASGLSFVGPTTLVNNALQLTAVGKGAQDAAAWYSTPVDVQTFTTDFYFQETTATGEGFTFTLQNAPAGLSAVGSIAGGGLGYEGIGSSVAVKFDLYDDVGEGIDSTGFYTDGAAPMLPSVDMSDSGINLHSSDILHAHITYDGTILTLTLIDTVTSASFTTSTAINIPGIVGGNNAYVGFTGSASAASASGPGATATQTILNWTYVSSSASPPTAATPTFAPSAGKYSSPQSVVISDATAGATIYYTTNGTAPTTSSPVYSTPITVSADVTLKAIAAAANYANSAVATAAYIIAAATPTFTPAHGYYATPQSITISDATSGATMYYTTNGTTPTTSSSMYSTPITVSADETLKAFAVAPNYANSAVATAAYKIAAATPTFAPTAGTYSSAQLVTISDSTPGATIYYTTDGTTPTTSSPVYSTPITVSTNETLKAIAAANNYSDSLLATAAYKIK